MSLQVDDTRDAARRVDTDVRALDETPISRASETLARLVANFDDLDSEIEHLIGEHEEYEEELEEYRTAFENPDEAQRAAELVEDAGGIDELRELYDNAENMANPDEVRALRKDIELMNDALKVKTARELKVIQLLDGVPRSQADATMAAYRKAFAEQEATIEAQAAALRGDV